MLNLQKLQEASNRDAFGTQNSLHINVSGAETLCFAGSCAEQNFFGNFLHTKPNHICFEIQKILYYGRILVYPPGFFHAQQLWNRNLLKPLLRMFFYCTKIFIIFFERNLFIKIICGEFYLFFFPYFFYFFLDYLRFHGIVPWHMTGGERNK
jgi:hypothetical protein